MCLQETKIQVMAPRILLPTLGQDFDQYTVRPAEGSRGGIIIAWRSCNCIATNTRIDNFSTSVRFRNADGKDWWFTGIYGPQPNSQKIQFLQELSDIRAVCTDPWVVAGYFNLIYRSEDKNNDSLDRAMMGRFRRLLNDIELKEIDLLGRRYTWSNERWLRPWFDLTGFSAQSIGRTCFTTASFRARQREYPIAAHYFWGSTALHWPSVAFTLRPTGPGYLGSWMLYNKHGQSRRAELTHHRWNG